VLFFLSAAAYAFTATGPAAARTIAPGAFVRSPVLAAKVPELSGVRDLGRAPQTLPITLTITLAYRHDAELQQLIELQSDPTSRHYHRYLSNVQFATYFGPTIDAERNVVAALERAGFRIAARYPNRTIVDAVGPAALVERYFQTEIHQVAQPDNGVRYANVVPAVMPDELRGSVAAVTGLTNIIYEHTTLATLSAEQKAAAKARALAVFGSHATPLTGTRLAGFRTSAAFGARKPLATGNELHDNGFESGKFGSWLACYAYTTSDPEITSAKAHSGKYSSFAGSVSAKSGEIDLNAGVCQSVTIPTNGVLTFWVYQYSNEPNTSNAFQEADLLTAEGQRAVNFYATVNTTNGWKQLSYNVSKYAGGRYFLYFGVQGNGNKTHETYQYVDDVSLSGSAYPAKSAAIGGALLGPDFGYGPAVVADAYTVPVQKGYDGAGRATGVEISGDYLDTDLYGYLETFGIARGGTTTRVEVAGGAKFDPTSGSASEEATLDVETIVSLAPSTQLYMYLFPDLSDTHIEDGYNRAVSDNAVDVVNSSFGGCETGDVSFDESIDKIVAQGAAKGMTFSASSGDQGSAPPGCKAPAVNAPASTPDVVGVGGTSLFVNNNGSYNSEAAWSGSGGGVSKVWAIPSYQSGIKGVVGKTRNVPDIAFPADPNEGTSLFFAGNWAGPIGGTSWASPVFTAVQTETDQVHNSREGYVNPLIYSVYTKHGYGAFHDITSGSNGAYSAHSGYDDVTGIGSLKAFTFAGDE
jgi:subtilase family serine protease